MVQKKLLISALGSRDGAIVELSAQSEEIDIHGGLGGWVDQ